MPRHSLLIGVQAYRSDGGLTPLTCPVADVKLVEAIFSDMRYMGDKATARCLIDPTYGEATAQIGAFLRTVGRDDVCVFYFSGHGMRDASGDLFLCFTDTDERNLELSALNIKRLRAVFDAKFLRRVLIVLDCCYSGAAGAPLTKDSLASKLDEVEEARSDGTGLYVLSSAGAAETAKEGKGHSVFTSHFVEGIASGAADRDGRGDITVQDIAQYVVEHVPQDSPGQKPLLSSRSVAGSFVVALNAAAQARRLEEEEERARAEIFERASGRLMETHRAKDVSLSFMLEILGWIERSGKAPTERPPMPLLAAYGTRECGLDELIGSWNAWKAEGSDEARNTARASAKRAEAQAAGAAAAAPEGAGARVIAPAGEHVRDCDPEPAQVMGAAKRVQASAAGAEPPPEARRGGSWRPFLLFLGSAFATVFLSFLILFLFMAVLESFGLANETVAVFVLAFNAGLVAYLIGGANRRFLNYRGANKASVVVSSLAFAAIAVAIGSGDDAFAGNQMPIWLATVCPACFFGLTPFRGGRS